MFNYARIYSTGIVLCASITSMHSALAADTRTVTEPVIPTACTILKATGNDATQIIQKALNSCSNGQAVKLVANGSQGSFYSGALVIPSGVSLWVDQGASLRALNKASAFDNGSGTCGTLDKKGNGCSALITMNSNVNSGIYGAGTIDGQGGATLTDKNVSWWTLAQQAKTSGSKQNAPRLVQINKGKNITLYKITLKDSPNFHVVFKQGDGLTAWKVTINTPKTARNTDGIDPISSKNVTVAHSYISTGDDNVAIKANAGAGSSSNMSFIDNNFGAGHGLSIGSETTDGVYNIDVKGLTLNGTTNGLRIKSDASASGEVSNVNYTGVTMTNVPNAIVMDTIYEKKSGSTKANWHDVNYNNVTVNGASKFIFNGTNASKPLSASMRNMNLSNAKITWTKVNANVLQF
ncbi:glycoside hydrolase family 28 protein [Acinetobacter sp. MD2(2019)]|uniref:glycoside hydrolase family 28 protein n=1 Tax=Acinetobacter sp. MD2(2019) TaxID=2605273 RepID=UPI002D1E58B7|nr:glycosyl hydrolase family 28 protein [Acinetobacter sp. MD2(2019)]MEB3753744.1 endopolygalacturonase [Acinetobacter sp. MD2(2019)]